MTQYHQHATFQMFAQPPTEGNLTIDYDQANDLLVEAPEFFVAVTLSQLESTSIDLPLCVCRVTQANWKKV